MTLTLREVDFYEELGRRIRLARVSKGMSQEQLAHAIDYDSGAAVSYWEAGLHKPALHTVLELEAILGVKLHDC